MIPKFRAWDKDEKVMRIVNEIHFTIKTITCEPLKGHDNMLEMYDPICFEGHFDLMQSTGLKDKNGVEIYEGDIVVGQQHLTTDLRTPFEIKGVVKYSKINTMFYLDNDSFGHQKFMSSLGSSIHQYEVIGNIYENPELLNLR